MNPVPYWRVQRALERSSTFRWLWLAAMSVCMCTLGWASWRIHEVQAASAALALDRLDVSLERHREPIASAGSTPERTSAAAVLKQLEMAAAAANVHIASAQLHEQSTNTSELSQMRLTATVRASYPATKEALRQLRLQVSNSTISALQMRGAIQEGSVDTTLEIVVWSAPRSQ